MGAKQAASSVSSLIPQGCRQLIQNLSFGSKLKDSNFLSEGSGTLERELGESGAQAASSDVIKIIMMAMITIMIMMVFNLKTLSGKVVS